MSDEENEGQEYQWQSLEGNQEEPETAKFVKKAGK